MPCPVRPPVPVPRRGVRALREWRASIEGRTYFVTACTHQRQPTLSTPEAAGIVFNALHAVETQRHEIELIASVVMPDHVHAVFRLHPGIQLQGVMKRFRGVAAHRLNQLTHHQGQVWERGYFDRLLRPDDRLLPILRYLWSNPIPAGRHFRCRADVWAWFETCLATTVATPQWMRLADGSAAVAPAQ